MTLSLIVRTAAGSCVNSWQCRARLCIRTFLHFIERTCVPEFVFVNNSGLLPVTLAFWDAIPSENTVKTFMTCMLANNHAHARVCMCLLGARKYVHVHDEIILRRLSTLFSYVSDTLIAYRTLDRNCITPQHFSSSFSVYEILYSTEFLMKFREIVMSFSENNLPKPGNTIVPTDFKILVSSAK